MCELLSRAVDCIWFVTHVPIYQKWGLQCGHAKRCWDLQECGLEEVDYLECWTQQGLKEFICHHKLVLWEVEELEWRKDELSLCLTSCLTTSQLSLSWHKPRYSWEEESPLSEWPTGVSVGLFLSHQLMIEGPAHREQCQPQQVVLGCIRKAAKRARRRKVVTSVPSWFLPWILYMNWSKPFSLRIAVGHYNKGAT